MEMGPNEIRLYIQLIYGLVTPIIISKGFKTKVHVRWRRGAGVCALMWR